MKPSNILIAEYDQEAVVKIIDFGVAKALYQSLTDKTLYTKRLNIVGTLQYMSPEQAKMNQRDIDTRSDVYALGVVLYELLTSRPPFERKTLEDAGLEGMCKIIREQEPPKPSARMLTMEAKTATDVAKRRSSQIQLLSKSFKGDLDWIVMKALEKDRNRRYETANGLSKDIERYLANEGVTATPPTVGYRLWKTYSRNKGAFWAGGAFAALLLVATIVSATGWASAFSNASELKVALKNEKKAKAAAEENAKEARESAVAEKRATSEAKKMENVASAVNEFLVKNFILAVAPSDEFGRGRDAKLRDVIKVAVENLDHQTKPGGSLADEPLVEAKIREAIGIAFTELGEFEFAKEQLQKAVDRYTTALPETNELVLDARLRLAEAFYWLHNRNDDEKSMFQAILTDANKALGADHRISLWAKFHLAFIRRPRRYRDLIPIAEKCEQLGPEFNELRRLSYASAATATGGNVERTLLFIKKAEGVPDVSQPRSRLSKMMYQWQRAYSYSYSGDHAKAETVYGNVISEAERLLGKKHHIYRVVFNNHAVAKLEQGKVEKAKQTFFDLRTLSQDGDAHHLSMAATNLGAAFSAQQKYSEAAEYYLEAYRTKGYPNRLKEALFLLRADGRDEEAKKILMREKQIKLEAINNGELKKTEFADDLLTFTYRLFQAGEFETVVEICELVNASMDSVADFHPMKKYYFGINEACSRQYLAEHSGNIDELRRSIAHLKSLDELADAELSKNGTSNFYKASEAFIAKASLARAYMHDEIRDLEKAELAIFDAYFGCLKVRPAATGSLISRELDRLLLLTGRSKGESQKRLIARIKEMTSQDPDNHRLAINSAAHLHGFGAYQAAFDIIEKFDWDQFKENTDLQSRAKAARATYLLALGRNDEAKQIALQIRANTEVFDRWHCNLLLGEIARRDGNLDEAEQTLVQAILEIHKYKGGSYFEWIAARKLRDLVKTRLERGEDPNEFHCVKVAQSIVDEGTFQELDASIWFFLCLFWNDEFAVSQRLAQAFVDRREDAHFVDADYHTVSLEILGLALMEQGKFEAALPYLEKARILMIDNAYPSFWQGHKSSLVGRCFVGLKRYEEAEATLTDAFDRLYKCYTPNWQSIYDPSLTRCAESCVRLYQEWDRAHPSDELKQKLKHWRAEQQRIAKMLEPNEEIEK